jgi:multiple sugar transport system ATP-binding protein
MTMGDRIGLMNKGRLVQVGTPHEIYNRPKNSFVAAFVGTPAINMFDVHVDLAAGRATDGALSFDLEPETRHALSGLKLPEDGRVRIGVRPENVRLVQSGGIAGSLYGAEHHGAEIIAILQSGSHMLRATIAADTRVAVNQPLQFSFAQDKLHFFHPLTGENLRHWPIATKQ